MDDIHGAFATPFDNPLVPRFPIEMRDTEILTVVYRTDAEAARRLVPAPLVTTREPAASVTSPCRSIVPPEKASWPLFVSPPV